MPTVSDGGRTYSFRMRTGVRFSPPVNREVEPSDIKFAIERLFRIDSGGVGFYTGIVGANAYAKTKKGGIKGHRRERQGAHDRLPPDLARRDVPRLRRDPVRVRRAEGHARQGHLDGRAWRVATGPYMITTYVPKQQIVLKRNPNFKQWTPNSPNGHLDEIDIKIGVTPEAAVNMTTDGQLDWYFGAVPGDRLAELKARYPKQVFTFDRNNITYFEMNHRKPPFDKLAVRQALNYAVDRTALVKIFGGQGIPTENIVPPGLGAAYVKHHFYPYDLAKAKALVQSSGDAGMAVTVWSHSTDPAPKAAAVHGERARLARLQGERQDARRVGLLGHDLDAEGRSPDRVRAVRPGLPRGAGLHRRAAERRAHRERRQPGALERRHPRAEQAHRRGPRAAVRPGARPRPGHRSTRRS